jgi:uncharacterized protein YjbI with pentapeptide repeats
MDIVSCHDRVGARGMCPPAAGLYRHRRAPLSLQETKLQETKLQETKLQETKLQETKLQETRLDTARVAETLWLP